MGSSHTDIALKLWFGRKIMSDCQDRLLWMGTQTAARGVLAIYLQKSVILAATLCLLPREFHCSNNVFWKSMIFQPFRSFMHICIFRIFTIHAKPIQLCNDFLRSKFPKRKKVLNDFEPLLSSRDLVWLACWQSYCWYIIQYKADKINNSSGFNVSLKRYWWP